MNKKQRKKLYPKIERHLQIAGIYQNIAKKLNRLADNHLKKNREMLDEIGTHWE